jgi:serine protease
VLQSVKAAVSRAELNRAASSSAGSSVAPLSVSYARKLAVGSELVRTSRKLDQGETQALMAQLAADPAVANVQPDYRKYAVQDFASPVSLGTNAPTAKAQAFTPGDPDYPQYQWHFFNPIGGANINNAWDIADGSGATVAVIDTGITQHPDLDYSLASANIGYDFISDTLVSGRATDDRVAGGWDLGDWDNTQPYLQECYGSNNVAMYVKAGTAPTDNGSNADFSSVKPGTSQAVVIARPQAATYYIRAAATQGGYSNISVLADYGL